MRRTTVQSMQRISSPVIEGSIRFRPIAGQAEALNDGRWLVDKGLTRWNRMQI